MITFQSIPEAIPIGIAAVLSSVLVVLAWRRRAMPMAPAFATMMAGETIWCPWRRARADHHRAPHQASLHRSTNPRCRHRDSGLAGVRFSLLRVGPLADGTAVRRDLRPAIPLIVLAWTDPIHHLYFAQLSNERIGESWIAIRSFGPGFWGMLAYCYALMAVSTVLLANAVIRSTGVYRAQAAVMLFGVLLPWVVDIIDMAGMVRFIPVDLVSPTFALTGLSFLPGLFRFRLLDLTPVAWAVVVEGMDDPVVVIDRWARIVALNPAAERLIGRKSHEVIGLEAALAFSHWPALADRLRGIEGNQESTTLDGSDPEQAALIRCADLAPRRRRPSRPVGSWSCATSPNSSAPRRSGFDCSASRRPGPRPRRPTGPRTASSPPSATSSARR